MLNFREPLVGNLSLTADQRAVAKREAAQAASAMSYVKSLLEGAGAPSRDAIHSGLYVVESTLMHLCKATGIELETAAEREARYAEIRARNERIRELEGLLGGDMTAEGLSAGLKHYGKLLEDWWDARGFGYIREIEFGKWGGCKLALSCKPQCDTYTSSNTPESDREAKRLWIEGLVGHGYSLIPEDERGTHYDLEDTPRGRELLMALIAEDLPSATVSELKTCVTRKGKFTLDTLGLYVHDLGDIQNLRGEANLAKVQP
jgi:hypothetical protein